MAKRALPQRSTRGQLPSHLREEPSLPKMIKNKPEDEQQKKRKSFEVNCKMNQILNLRKYPFGRAIHYFINLDQLSRAALTTSYAINDENILGQTYSKDSLFIKQSTIGQLVNRKLIGLPINTTGEIIARKQNKCKNVCYAYLFQIQDKKHNNDRLIYTIKIILKRLSKMSPHQLHKYDYIKKDSDLIQLLNQNHSLDQKKQILQNKLNTLITRKQANCLNWQFDDHVLFYHALNQRLHNRVIQLKNQFNQENLSRLIKQQVSTTDLQTLIDRKTRYYFTNTLTLSPINLQRLLMKLQRDNDKCQYNYPIATLHFNKDQSLHSLTDFLISRRAFSMGQVHFYEVKAMVKKLFKRQLKLKTQKISSYDQYYKQFRKRYDEICRFKRNKIDKQPKIQNLPLPLLDAFLNLSQKKSNQNIFCLSDNIQITKRQYMFLMVYFWLSQALSSIHQYLIQFNDLLQIIGSDFYPKVCNPLVEAIGTPLPGIIFYIFQALTDLISKPDPLSSINDRLFLEFNENLNVCMIWKGSANQSFLNNTLIEKTVLPNKKIKSK